MSRLRIRIFFYSLGQNLVDKFTKVSKIDISRECFTADFLQFSNATVEMCLLIGRLGTGLSRDPAGNYMLKVNYRNTRARC